MNKLIYLFLVIALIIVIQLIAHLSYCETGSDQPAKIERLEGKKDSCTTFIDLSKLIISLSTGVFVLLPAFLEKIRNENLLCRKTLYTGLISLLISIVFGLFVIAALAGSQRIEEYNIAALHIKLTSMIQWATFLWGLFLCGLFLLKNLFAAKITIEENNQAKNNQLINVYE